MVLAYCKAKGKIPPVTCHEAQTGNRGIALLSPNLSGRWGWMVIATPLWFHPQEELWDSFTEAGWGTGSILAGFEEQKVPYLPLGFEPHTA
jgi:hypothetical protein